MFQDFVAAELRVYLLKFADKIVHICKGNLALNHNLLSNVLKFMLPAQQAQTNKAKNGKFLETGIISSRHEEMIGKVCHTLWQSLKN